VEIQVSLPLAFAAGLVSFLSPCVLPLVPSYLALVSGLGLEEIRAGGADGRRGVLAHASLFVVGFALVFMTLGLVSTALGAPVARALPWLARAGGLLLVVLGLHLAGVLRPRLLEREVRPALAGRAGVAGWSAFTLGMAFAAGWTPCIGPVLASILLYAGLETTMVQGTALLGAYAAGLGVPFLLAGAGLDAFLRVAARARRWLVPLQRVAGAVLVVIGLLMLTDRFTAVSATLAGMGQLIELDLP